MADLSREVINERRLLSMRQKKDAYRMIESIILKVQLSLVERCVVRRDLP
jgi:hypothetical protein